jgi:hypothetical protein
MTLRKSAGADADEAAHEAARAPSAAAAAAPPPRWWLCAPLPPLSRAILALLIPRLMGAVMGAGPVGWLVT